MKDHNKINYIEIPSKDLEVSKTFFSKTFGWKFTDFGPKYTFFKKRGVDGGFYKSDHALSTETGRPLIIFYSCKLEDTQSRVVKHGGKIKKPIFTLSGGQRFHFTDPNGNEYAVWSDEHKV